jgi:4,5-dihydroxyphthalate decarboxylase
VKLHTLLGDYANTHSVRANLLRSPGIEFDFADVKVPNRGFKRVVREVEFHVAELAIVTFFQARAYGKPLVLVPASIVGRPQHQCIVYNAERGKLTPKDLEGKRVGTRAYAQTTSTWVRGMLAEEHGVDMRKVTWVTFEDGHLAEYQDPSNCERAAGGKEMMAMLGAGEIDAAIVGNEGISDPRFKTLVEDPAAAHEAWCRRHGAVPVNHLLCVKSSLSQSDPQALQQIFQLFIEAKEASAGSPANTFGGRDMLPFGFAALRPSLEIALDYSFRQGLLPRRLGVDELFDATTRELRPV